MGKAELITEALKLREADRFEVMQALADSLAGRPDPDLTPEQEGELDRRIALADQNPGRGTQWPEVRDLVLSQLRNLRKTS